MKKKAFTLVEVIAAVAILSIVIVAVTSAFISGTKTWRNGEQKLDTMFYAQGISEAFMGANISKITQLCNDEGSSAFVYFNDDYKDFVLYTVSGYTSLTSAGTPPNFIDWFNFGPKIQGKVSNDDFSYIDTNIYSKCKNNNSNRKYGAYIAMQKDSRASTAGTVYYVKVIVWDLMYGYDSPSVREVYIGR
ncbi:type II secretion system GspH family protein [Clostridium sp. SYSU_GA19001]|uniref:PilW family protein n=1 Tax=Clostridium caldaquaticum TaxID=2940653 RepID=UPI00207730F5|nr:type II secretion system protein [Clostridium caldaquaticum]MCM8711508.1 type II secretion system GspH family protein [Clostridium caldaquaticum]